MKWWADILRGIHFVEAILAACLLLYITIDSLFLAMRTPKDVRHIHMYFCLSGIGSIALFTGIISQTWKNFGTEFTFRTASFLVGFTIALWVLTKLAKRSVRIGGAKQFEEQ